jgi:superfamily II DNA or RNA helicase
MNEEYMESAKQDTRKLLSHYRTRENDLVEKFFIPCFNHCNKYQRAAGYFSSSALTTWASLLERLSSENISIELLISPEMQPDDIQALKVATSNEIKREQLQSISDAVIEKFIADTANKKNRLDVFSWLIINEKLKIKFAYPIHQEDSDLFHQKTGIFYFPWGDIVAFEGSANESYSGHRRNWEKVQVFRSWIAEDLDRLKNTKLEFEEYWRGLEDLLVVVDLSSKSVSKLKAIAPKLSPIKNTEKNQTPSLTAVSWAHQTTALNIFLAKKAGILEMATGTGKTKTSLKILLTLLQETKVSQAIICTNGTDLLNQWYQEVIENNVLKLGLIDKVFRQFASHKEAGSFLLHQNKSILIISRDQLPRIIHQISSDKAAQTLIIHDEVHGMGSEGNIRKLIGTHGKFIYKLGLSATPEREYDQEGSIFIESEVGPIIYSFSIEDAIKQGILVEFDYVAIPYELSEGDRIRLRAVRARQAMRQKEGMPMSQEEVARSLADVYKTAENKPRCFKHLVKSDPDVLKNSIIFVATKNFGEEILDVVSEFGHNYRTYYDDDSSSNLIKFSKGEIDTLITCHKISQGIDIQKLKTVVLIASDRAKLETIQRIGRCLRSDVLNPEKRALVIDFYNIDATDTSADIERKDWLTRLSKIKREISS